MIHVRYATAEDSPRLVELHGFVHDLHARQRPDVFVAEPDRPRLESFFRDALDEPSARLLVAELPSSGAVAGYALARVVEQTGTLHVREDRTMKLEHLAVDPGAARGGVGTALVEAVREAGRAAGCRRLGVNVWYFNAAARSFYEAAGLTPMTHLLEQTL